VRRIATVMLVFLAGCPICPCGGMEVVEGRDDGKVEAGDVIELRAHYGGWSAGPGNCNGSWAVNHIIGGNAEVGTIDDCGRYQAPAVMPAGLESILIEAADYDLRALCVDCCPYAAITLEPVP
jgi:hypothetical protein